MLFKEIKHNLGNFSLSLFGVVIAVACILLFVMMTNASRVETIRLTRDMGFNLKLIPNETDMNDFWVEGYSSNYMPEDYVQAIVDAKAFTYAHLTATLHKQIQWKGHDVVLTGISPDEVETTGRKKSKMIFSVPKDKVYVGYEIADALNIKDGDKLDILGSNFEVERTLAETGSNDDIRIYLDLAQLQKILKLEGQINEIMALNCLCLGEGVDYLDHIRNELSSILPKAKLVMNKTIATARENQRFMMEKYTRLLMPIFLLVCALWIAIFSMQNVMSRKVEIGLLRSLGFNMLYISRLFVCRILIIGVIGAVVGFGLAMWFGVTYGPVIFKVTARSIQVDYMLLCYSLILAPLFAVIASIIPITVAIKQEPAKVLKDI